MGCRGERPQEEYIPDALVFEAEFALAREQLETQTPEVPADVDAALARDARAAGAARSDREPCPAGTRPRGLEDRSRRRPTYRNCPPTGLIRVDSCRLLPHRHDRPIVPNLNRSLPTRVCTPAMTSG